MKPNNNLDGFVSKRKLSLGHDAVKAAQIQPKLQGTIERDVETQATKRATISGLAIARPKEFTNRNLSSRATSLAEPISTNNNSKLINTYPKHHPRKRTHKIIFSLKILVLSLLVTGLFLVGKFFYTSSKLFNGSPLGFFRETTLKGESQGAVNIILVGTSEDDPDHPGADLTDSMMLISITPENNKASILSIPRDLYVQYGDGYYTRINEIYDIGEKNEFLQSGYFKGGMGNVQSTVEDVTGIKVDYYAKVNYAAFKSAVDAVGGITIDVQGSDERGIYDPNFDWQYGINALKLKNGVQKLTGTQALLLARARNANGGYGLAGSDFDRTENQRKMLIALKDKMLSLGTISNPAKLSKLISALGDNVETNLTSGEIRRLYELQKDTPYDVQSSALTTDNYLVDYTADNGAKVLVPSKGLNIYTDIKNFVKKLGNKATPLTLDNPNVVILNDGAVVGSAQKLADDITAQGADENAIYTDNYVGAGEFSTNTLIVLNDTKSNSTNYLKAKYGLIQADTASSNQKYFKALYPEADFVIILKSSIIENSNTQ